MAYTHFVTAVSLHPLPPSAELREIVWDYLARQRPSDLLRDLADALDAADVPDRVPPAAAAHHEADEFLEDYRDQVYRRTYRCTPEHAARLKSMSRATGLGQTSIIRAALHDARARQETLDI